jgi:ABC-type multidrug transport system ATPase subunit
MAEAESLCASVAVIRAGRLIAMGSPDVLRARTGTRRVEMSGRGFHDAALAELRERPEVTGVQRSDGHLVIELAPEAEPAPLVSLLVRHGAEVNEVRYGQANLEAVFVKLMEEE